MSFLKLSLCSNDREIKEIWFSSGGPISEQHMPHQRAAATTAQEMPSEVNNWREVVDLN